MAEEKNTSYIVKVKSKSHSLSLSLFSPLYLSLSLAIHNVYHFFFIGKQNKTLLSVYFVNINQKHTRQTRPDLNNFSTITSFESYQVNSLSMPICKLETQLWVA